MLTATRQAHHHPESPPATEGRLTITLGRHDRHGQFRDLLSYTGPLVGAATALGVRWVHCHRDGAAIAAALGSRRLWTGSWVRVTS